MRKIETNLTHKDTHALRIWQDLCQKAGMGPLSSKIWLFENSPMWVTPCWSFNFSKWKHSSVPFFVTHSKVWKIKHSPVITGHEALPCFFGRWFLLVLWTPPWCSSAVRHAGGWNWSQCSSTPLDLTGFDKLEYLRIYLKKKSGEEASSSSASSTLSHSPHFVSPPLFYKVEEGWKKFNKKREGAPPPRPSRCSDLFSLLSKFLPVTLWLCFLSAHLPPASVSF